MIFYILICSSCITLFATGSQLYVEYRWDVGQIEERMGQIQESYMAGLTNSIWITDLKQTRVLLEGIVRLPDLRYLEIRMGGQQLAEVGTLPQIRRIDRQFVLNYHYQNEDFNLGTLYAVASLDGVYQRLLDKILVILLAQAVKTFLVSGCIFFIVQFLFTRHLSTMASYVGRLDLPALDKPLQLSRESKDDEIEDIFTALNRMREKLGLSYRELEVELSHRIQLEQKLLAYKENLEEKVHEQTLELTNANEKIQTSLEEKEVLLKEIHHRVKNNMQVISSMLRLQAREIEDPEVQKLFRESQHRIQAMSLVHENLYQSKDLVSVNTHEFVNKLIQELFSSYQTPGCRIQPVLEIEHIVLGIDHAIPCGLIINELVTNALKYAFPGSKTGEVRISLKRHSNDRIQMDIEDNGLGLPEGTDPQSSNTLGLKLVSILSKQLRGEYVVNKKDGTHYQFSFQT